MEQNISTTQYSIGQILAESWKQFKLHMKPIVLITLAVYIPVNIILSFVPFDALVDERGIWEGLRIYAKIVEILEILIGIIAIMAIAYLIKSRMDGASTSPSEALKAALSRWPAALWTSIMLGVFLLGLTLLLIVPGIIFGIYWIFALYPVILYGKSGKSALNYSKAIVKGRWWRVLFYTIVFGVLGAIIGFAAGFIVGIPYGFLPENILLDVATDTVIDIVTSYFTVVFVIFFLNFDSTKRSGDASTTPVVASES